MRLLIDENLSERLVSSLADLFPDSLHVRLLGLAGTRDETLWSLARREGCVLLTRDEDFLQLSLVRGAPPKVILLRFGNCSTAQVSALLRASASTLRAFIEHPELTFLELEQAP